MYVACTLSIILRTGKLKKTGCSMDSLCRSEFKNEDKIPIKQSRVKVVEFNILFLKEWKLKITVCKRFNEA